MGTEKQTEPDQQSAEPETAEALGTDKLLEGQDLTTVPADPETAEALGTDKLLEGQVEEAPPPEPEPDADAGEGALAHGGKRTR